MHGNDDRAMYFSENYAEKINNKLDEMSETELRVAEYILNNKDNCVKLSISEMAGQCGVSSATVVRFCKLLGYSGYAELKFQIQKISSDFSKDNLSIFSHDSPASMKQKSLQFTQYNLGATVEKNNGEQLDKAAKLIANADHVLLSAMGSASGVALAASNLLLSAGVNASYHDSDMLQMKSAAFLKKNDVVIGINYDGYSKAVTDTFMVAKRAGAHIILITSFDNTILTEYADIVLYTPVRNNSNVLNFTTTSICQMMIIQLLMVDIWQQSGPDIDKKSSRVRTITDIKRYTMGSKEIILAKNK